MRIILFGAPGCGKGTQADVISNYYNIKRISLGDILRKEVTKDTAQALEVKKYMQKGLLVPDNLVSSIIKKYIDKEGFVLDGYPRNLQQVLDFENICIKKKICYNAFIYLEVSKETIINRLSKRLICSNCNTNYHTDNMPPKVEGVCDRCLGVLIKREDDNPAVIEKRLEVFLDKSKEILDFYKTKNKLIIINANGDRETVFARIKEKLEDFIRCSKS